MPSAGASSTTSWPTSGGRSRRSCSSATRPARRSAARSSKGPPEVRIHGRRFKVRARIAQIHGFSGHADRSDLLRWLGAFRKPPRKLFLTHGEAEAAEALAAHIRRELGWTVEIPAYGDATDLD